MPAFDMEKVSTITCVERSPLIVEARAAFTAELVLRCLETLAGLALRCLKILAWYLGINIYCHQTKLPLSSAHLSLNRSPSHE